MSQLFSSLRRRSDPVEAPVPAPVLPSRLVKAPARAPIRWCRSSAPWTGPGMAVYHDTTEAAGVMFPEPGPAPVRIVLGSEREP